MNMQTLEEVLKLINEKVPIIIEIKFDNKIGKLEKATSKILDNYKGEFAIQIFNPLSILWFKLNRKNFVRGYLINSVFSTNFLINYLLNSKFMSTILAPNYIGVNINYLKNKKINKLRSKYLIIGYTITTKEEYNKYEKYADNFICNIGKEPYR